MTDTTVRLLADYTPSSYEINTIDLVVELHDTKTRVKSTLLVKRTSEQSSALVLDGHHLTLIAIKIDDRLLTEQEYTQTDESLTLNELPEQFTLEIETEINPLENTSLEGLFKSGEAFCTQCEAEGFRNITYYLDRPDVMAKFTCKIIADKALYPHLLSNGNKIAHGDLPQGKHFVQWQDPFPKPCYLFALVAGNFDVLTDNYETATGRDVALEIFVDKGNLHKAHHAMASLKKAMKWDEDTFGLSYDLDMYMIVAVDFFNMGAMENKGLNVFNSKYVLADKETATDSDYFNIEAVIAHEYFHNWTGNRVTCRDWFQLSLKEGLTVFRDQQFSADMHSPAVCRIKNVRVLRSMQFAEDAGPMSHPIRPEKVMEMNNFYTLTVYEKGAEVIRMIHTLLGKEKFRKGMDLYFERFDGMAVTCDDFVNAMADASGVDLSLFKRWYAQSGTPILKVEQQWQPQNKELSVTISQIHEPSLNQPVKSLLHIPVQIELFEPTQGIHQQQLLQLTDSTQTWTFEGFNHQPVISLLGGFSAPVKLTMELSDESLQLTMIHAHDLFSRWDAGQKLFIRYIQALVENEQYQLPNSLIDTFKHVLLNSEDDEFTAEQLELPSFDEMMELFEQIDPTKVVRAIEQLKLFLANGLKTHLIDTYRRCYQEKYTQDKVATAKRALKNTCLSYLALLDDSTPIIAAQFDNADNMTDKLAAMKCASVANADEFSRQMALFEQQWLQVPLVLDKWFMLAASAKNDTIFEQLNKLLTHPEFNLKNPNRARSLIAGFTQGNPLYFHDKSGKGYQFLADQISALNTINPQVAARLITPLIQFKRYDEHRQNLIKQQLVKLSKMADLSIDLQEKLTAALA